MVQCWIQSIVGWLDSVVTDLKATSSLDTLLSCIWSPVIGCACITTMATIHMHCTSPNGLLKHASSSMPVTIQED